jgi:hypothetical protein
MCAPVCKHLKLHPTRVEDGRVMIGVEDEA